jgi:hypothetical protein
VTINLLYPDFFSFLDALAAGAEPWRAYRQFYFEPHREILSAYLSKVMRLPGQALKERVRAVRPQHYAQLRELVTRADLVAVTRQAIRRCQRAARYAPPPQVALLVGFFSPDAFLFKVSRRWCIGVGLERWRELDALPLFLAHEYGHYLRRLAISPPTGGFTLAEAIASEGVAVAFSRHIYPERSLAEHLRVPPARLRWWQQHASLLWSKALPRLGSSSPRVIQTFVSGDPRTNLSRCAAYLGCAAIAARLAQSPSRLSAADRRITQAPASQVLDQARRGIPR